jgi:3-hydroxyacyl-[acyl-carrier-protein] dehydratase
MSVESKIIDINTISKLLPHAYPFLLIDKIIEMKGDDYGIGIKNVTINEPFFQGHFPGNPIMPGVLQIEGMAQTAAVICMVSHNMNADANPKIFFMTIDKARFRKPVIPGDIIYYYLKKIRQRSNVWKYKGEAYVQGSLIAEAEISAMIDNSAHL